MPVPLFCPRCGHAYRVPDNLAKKAKCPTCGETLRPQATGTPAAPPPAPPGPAPSGDFHPVRDDPWYVSLLQGYAAVLLVVAALGAGVMVLAGGAGMVGMAIGVVAGVVFNFGWTAVVTNIALDVRLMAKRGGKNEQTK